MGNKNHRKYQVIGDLSSISTHGIPEFAGKIQYEGSYKFEKGTTFSIVPREDSDENPLKIFFDLEIESPDENLPLVKIRLEDELRPDRHLRTVLCIPVTQMTDDKGKPFKENTIFAFLINNSPNASLKISNDEDDPEMTFLLKYEGFEAEGIIEASSVPGFDDFAMRNFKG